MHILKCPECGNTFKVDQAKENQIAACPVCESNQQIHIKDGRITIKEFLYESEDLGELL